MKRILFETSGIVVFEDGLRLIFKKKTGPLLKFFIPALGFTLLSFFLSKITDQTAFGIMAWWATCIFVGVSFLFALIVLYTLFFGTTVIDRIQHEIRTPRKRVLLSDVTSIEVQHVTIMDTDLYCLTALLKKGKIYLVEGQSPVSLDSLRGLEKTCNIVIGKKIAEDRSITPSHTGLSANIFIGSVIIGIGAVWSIAGFFLIPDIVLTHFSNSPGVLLWPLGIWIIILGLFECWETSLFPWRESRIASRKLKFILIALWTASYFIICIRY
jgi:hypothetical protein